MRKIYLILLTCIAFTGAKATSYTVNISGFSYSPSTLTVSIGDVVTISASAVHALVQVDFAAYSAPTNTPMAGGWGVQASNYTFTITTASTIYYVCQAHYSMGMKGEIIVNTAGISEKSNFLQGFNLFPNPSQNSVSVNFSLSTASNVTVKLFNLLGQEVSVLTTAATLPVGNHNYSYELPASISNGGYLIEVSTNTTKSIKKFIINR